MWRSATALMELQLSEQKNDSLELLDREDLLKLLSTMMNGGVVVNFHGKRTAMEICKKVRPRVTRRVSELHVGTPEEQTRNMLVEGENLQAMVTLYKYRGQVDLIVTDPPYNTGQQFRYNDKWDTDPNDPDLGTLVPKEDGSRHTKWMKAMMPRLHMMKAMLKPTGVIAICIDANELFHLGMMMDEVFDETNRLAIINWQKSSPKSQATHISVTTEYVLVYAKDAAIARTGELERSVLADARFANPDDDKLGEWKQDNLTAKDPSKNSNYAIQSPFTGEFHNPGTRHWSNKRSQVKEWLEEWNVKYEDFDLGDGRGTALALKGWSNAVNQAARKKLLDAAAKKANSRLEQGNWPILYWGMDGLQKPVRKVHKALVRQGAVPNSFWVDDDEGPVELGDTSWLRNMSGRSRDGIEELDQIVGKGHKFETVKPLRLMKKIIQIWCPANGLVMDPYAGSGTTGHAVLELNRDSDSDRRFILIEQGKPDDGDKYARTLTWQRLKHVLSGQRYDKKTNKLSKSEQPCPGGFEFRVLTNQIDAKTVLSMRRDELVDVVITSHWESGKRNAPTMIRIDEPKNYKYLVGKNETDEGYFIIWDGDGPVGQLDTESYRLVLQEGKKAGLKPPYHVYARYEIYQSKNVLFYKIPDKILAHLGLNESSDRYNDTEED